MRHNTTHTKSRGRNYAAQHFLPGRNGENYLSRTTNTGDKGISLHNNNKSSSNNNKRTTAQDAGPFRTKNAKALLLPAVMSKLVWLARETLGASIKVLSGLSANGQAILKHRAIFLTPF